MFHYFTIKFHFSFLASFRFQFFALLHFSNFRFEVKQSEAKFKSIFSLFFAFFTFFHFFSLVLLFLLFFALNFLLRFDLVIFAWKRNKAKQNLSRFFRLIFTYFTFVFASDFLCFASK